MFVRKIQKTLIGGLEFDELYAFCANELPDLVKTLSSVEEWDSFCQTNEGMVKSLFLGKLDNNLDLRFVSYPFRKTLLVAVPSPSAVKTFRQHFHLDSSQSIVIQKEAISPFEVYEFENKQRAEEVLKENQFLHIPQLELWNQPLLCTTSNGFCIVFLSYGSVDRQQIDKLYDTKKSLDSKLRSRKIQFAWVNCKEQTEFCSFFSSSTAIVAIRDFRFYEIFQHSFDISSLSQWIEALSSLRSLVSHSICFVS